MLPVEPNVGISHREIGVLLPSNQRQHRTLHIQKNVLHNQNDVVPYALC